MIMRTISKAHEEILQIDPNTSITKYAIRTWVNTKTISSIRRGRKILLDLEELKDYLNIRKLEPTVETVTNNINKETTRKRTSRFKDIY